MQTGVDVAKLLSHKKKLETKRLRKEKKAAKKAKKEAKKKAKETAGLAYKNQVAPAFNDTLCTHECMWFVSTILLLD